MHAPPSFFLDALQNASLSESLVSKGPNKIFVHAITGELHFVFEFAAINTQMPVVDAAVEAQNYAFYRSVI